MSFKRPTNKNSTEGVEGRGGAGSLSWEPSNDAPRRAMTIADLDIETIQWLSDDLREGFAIYDPEDRLVVANAEYIRLHPAVQDILKPGMAFETMIRTMVARGAVEVPAGGEEDFIADRVRRHRNPAGAVLRRLSDGGAYIIKETRLVDGSIISRENDVSEIVVAREALHKSEERFKALAEIASDWFWETDAQHRLTSITLPQRLGIRLGDEIIGLTRWEIAGADPVNDPLWAQHKADLDAHRPFRDFAYSYVLRAGTTGHFRVSGGAVYNKSGLAIGYRSMPNNDGGRRHFSVSGVPIFDRSGKFRGYRGTSREITKEILMERRAAAAHQRLLDAIEALPESFILCDAEDRIVLCNSATYTRLPWCKTLLEPGMKYEDVLRDIVYTGVVAARGREEEWIRENIERHRAASGNRQYRRNDGRWVRVTERRTADGGMVMIRADITEEKQAELELEAALTQAREENRAKSTFMANLTHELRAPLEQIASLAKGMNPSVAQATEQALRLLDDVLDIARIQVGRNKLAPTDIDVAELLSECCAEAGRRWKGRKLTPEIAPNVGIVHADEPAMRHLLLSIIGNALNGGATADAVRVTACAAGDRIEIGVHDRNAAISEADLENLMRPFRSVAGQDSARRQATGFGVSFAIAGALASEIGGIFSVTSPPEGGIRVVVTMPQKPAAA